MHRRLMLVGICAAVALAAIAFGGISPAVRADGGGSISGRIINDLNGDGIQQPAEPGIVGWRVVLNGTILDPSGASAVVAETRTGADGAYRFSDLTTTRATYRILLPCDGQPVPSWIRTAPQLDLPGSLQPLTSDVTYLVQIPAEPLRTDGEITGRVVNDVDMDGKPDRGEQGLAGWQVALYRESPVFSCPGEDQGRFTYATADDHGVFDVKGLVEGTYSVGGQGGVNPPQGDSGIGYISDQNGANPAERKPARPSAWIQTCPVVPRTEPGLGDTLFAVSAEVNLTKDAMKATADKCIALLVGDGSISGDVFIDQNHNLIRDQGEPGTRPLLMALHYMTKRGLIVVDPWWVVPPLNNGEFTYQGLAAGHYVISASVDWRQPPALMRSPDLKLAKGQTITNVVIPIPPVPSTPTPTARPVRARPTAAMMAPDTGSGPSSGSTDPLPAALAAAIGVLGLAALAFAARRRIDAGTRG